MKRRSEIFAAATAAIGLTLIWVATARGQAPSAPRAPMSDEVFKNVQVRVGHPPSINGRDVQVVQGTTADRTLVTMYFDMESGLLTRLMRYTESPVGRIVTQYDYEDYRPVAGVRIPFKWIRTWLDGRSVFQLTDVQPKVNVPLDRFARPAQRP